MLRCAGAFLSIPMVDSHPSPQCFPYCLQIPLYDYLFLESLLSDCVQLDLQILSMLSLRVIHYQRNLGCLGLQNVGEAKK